MDNNYVSVSIVMYQNDTNMLKKAINSCLLSSMISDIYLIDNSPTDELKKLKRLDETKISYFFNDSNLGFGKAHNLAIDIASNKGSIYHLILNPDIFFNEGVIEKLVGRLQTDSKIGMIMPKILNNDSSVQLLPKLLPSIKNIFIRVIPFLRKRFNVANELYTLKSFMNEEMNVPVITGCFSLIRMSVFNELEKYDERFFMYFEDTDLSRRIHENYKTVYYPKVNVYHGYERGAAKNITLFLIFVKSAILYFNKYGWFIDKKRKAINKEVLTSLE